MPWQPRSPLLYLVSLPVILAGVIIFTDFRTPPETLEEIPHIFEMLFGWVQFAPIVETVIMMIRIGFSIILTDREWLNVFAVAPPLGLAHPFEGVSLFDAGERIRIRYRFPHLSLVYVVWRRVSLSNAFWMCAAVHMIHNFTIVVILLMGD